MIGDPRGENICFSGGAIGADTIFSNWADYRGHRVCNYSFPDHDTDCSFRFILNEKRLVLADVDLTKIAAQLDRGSFATYTPHTKNLLRRNWWIIKDVATVYAVARLKYDGSQVIGGTGWGIQHAINLKKIIYLYDMKEKYWLAYAYEPHAGLGPWVNLHTHKPPFPKGLYAGIGSRELTTEGVQAINALYEE